MPRSRVIPALVLCACAISCSGEQTAFNVPDIPAGDRTQAIDQQLNAARSRAEQSPGNAEALGRFALVLHKYGMHEQADPVYAQARKLAPGEFDWAYMHGYVLEALGNDIQARDAFAAAARIDPGRGATYLGVTQLKLGESEAARNTLLQALAYDEQNPRALYELGRLETAEGNLQLAEQYLSRALASGSDHPSIYYALAEIRKRQGDAAKAAEYLERFAQTSANGTGWPDPSLAPMGISDKNLMDAAVRALQRGDISGAIEFNEQARALNPDNPLPPAALIGLYAIAGDHQKSDEALAIARDLDPDSAQFHYNVGLARMAQNRLEEAVTAMRRVIAIDPEGSLPWIKLGDIYATQGKRAEAADAFARAYEKTPANQELRLKLGVLYVQLERYEDALATLSAPATGHLPEARRLWAVGRAHRYLDDTGQAASALSQAREAAIRAGNQRLAAVITGELEQLDTAVAN